MNNTIIHDPHTLAGGGRALENAATTELAPLDIWLVGLLVERMTTERLLHCTLPFGPLCVPNSLNQFHIQSPGELFFGFGHDPG